MQTTLFSTTNDQRSWFNNYFINGLFLVLFLAFSWTATAQIEDAPEYLGDPSLRTLGDIQREMEMWNNISVAITLGNIIGLATNDPEITVAQGGGDLDVAAEALARIPAASRARVNDKIDMLIALDGNDFNDEEREFWENFRDFINNPEAGEHDGRSANDPHIITLDGLRYSFQSVGEFILVRCDNELMEIQTRQSPIRSSMAANSAVALNVWGDMVSVYMDGAPDGDLSSPLRINGEVIPMGKKPVKLKNGGLIRFTQKKMNDIEVLWPTGEKALIYPFHSEGFKYLNVLVTVPQSKVRNYTGLLGDANTDPNDDLRIQNGKVLDAEPAYFDVAELVTMGGRLNNVTNKAQKTYLKKLNKKFGESWRVTDENSLFEYNEGQSTASFTDRSFPEDYKTLGDLSTEELRQARAICEAEGVEGEEMEACVYDVAFSGYNGFAKSAAKMAQAVDLIEDLGVRVPLKPFLPNNVEETLKREAERKIRNKIKFPKGKLGL